MTDFKSKVQIQWSFFFPTVQNETCIVAESIFTTVTVQQSKISKKKKTKIIFKSTLFFFKPNKTNIYFNSCSNYIFIYVEANFSQVVRYVVLLYSILFFPIQSPKGTVRYAPLNKWPKYWQGEKSSRFKYVQKLKHLHEHTHTLTGDRSAFTSLVSFVNSCYEFTAGTSCAGQVEGQVSFKNSEQKWKQYYVVRRLQ